MIEKFEYELKAEYELMYKGKESKAHILTNTLAAPLQEMRVFNEDNPWEDGWRNMLIFGDNLMALKTLYDDLKEGGPNRFGLRNKIKLIYIDPPFATKQDFMKDKEKAYQDKVLGAQFIEFIRKRLILLREILADDGNICVHIDWKKGHYIKAVLDEVFGEQNLINEIIWHYRRWSAPSGNFQNMHDTIFAYSKSKANIFNKVYTAATLIHQKKFDKGYDQNVVPIAGERRPQLIVYDREKMEAKIKAGTFNVEKFARIVYKEDKRVLASDVFTDIDYINSQAFERVEYPTQKPEKLIKRLIEAFTNEGDIVMDSFVGSGTTCITSEKTNRKWIGIDCGKLSIYTTQTRFVNLSTQVGSGEKDDRTQFQRIESIDNQEKNRGLLFISEKAKKGQLNITDDFLYKLHNLLLEFDVDEFGLVCPEEKFHISNYEEDLEGNKTIKKDHITYRINFIEPKIKQPKSQPLKPKSFVLFHAGVYDKEGILNLQWDAYLDFVMQLFEVRPRTIEISGFTCHGYIGVHPAYVWEYPLKKGISLDEEWVETLHKQLKGKAGERMYIIVPTNSVDFLQNDIKCDNTTYTFLKVPVSVLIRLIESYKKGDRDFKASFKQPKGKENVNEVIDAFGFDFISQPVIKYDLIKCKKIDGLFSEDAFVIRLNDFRSDGLLYSPEEFKPFETLSLVLIDYDYSKELFTMDDYQWGNDLFTEGNTSVDIPLMASKWNKGKVAVILIDVYGNEKTMVFNKKDFK
jgi:DNA modification methylase